MIPELKNNAENKMQKTLESLKSDLQKIRTGRAHVGLLDHVQVDYYGSLMPVNQVANITLIDARTIGVQPWEKNMVQKVEKAIRDSDLGLNPATQGELVAYAGRTMRGIVIDHIRARASARRASPWSSAGPSAATAVSSASRAGAQLQGTSSASATARSRASPTAR